MKLLRLAMVAILAFASGILPAQANPISDQSIHSSDTIISLGLARDKNGEQVEGYKIIHYKNGQARSVRSEARTTGTVCYAFLAKGAKWRVVEPWVVNASNNQGIGADTVFGIVNGGVNKWEDAADGVVGSGAGKNILGVGALTSVALVADEVAPDDVNEVYFGSVANPGVIAVTIVWGVFGGPIGSRRLVEWDQIYDQTDYAWSTTGNAAAMDLDNLVTHELGHSVGMADLYQADCTIQTMYGYADFGQTNKRTLEAGDITGVQTLYK